MLRGSIYTQCCSFTTKVMKDPLSAPFREPVSTTLTESQYAEYKQLIEHPMDLKTLYGRLKERDYYQTVQSWGEDFCLIFDNAIKYNSLDSYISGIALFFKKKFDKFYSLITMGSATMYSQRLNLLYSHYLEVLAHPPKNCDIHSSQVPIEMMKNGFEESSLAILADKLNSVNIKNKEEELGKIIDIDPQSRNEVKIDVGSLPEEKIKSLWKFVRKFT
ncbi:Bromodomain containing protein [Histomonas meleagridis]|uniref:Bromodomain containing protein n=1 Tax=Histomonas meleagridis TaxID=135588 RepID=UPI00355A8F7A|nr:Bromodomain containing protein [Histomonas meleagridis]KAH0805148.1 Bromodomain containing protein [Histomonas meleagridis]